MARAGGPFYATLDGEERSGMGFTVMESFMDRVEVQSAVVRARAMLRNFFRTNLPLPDVFCEPPAQADRQVGNGRNTVPLRIWLPYHVPGRMSMVLQRKVNKY